MENTLNEISSLWNNIPSELENTTLSADVKSLRMDFENNKLHSKYFQMKIMVIGNVSSGKSSLVNHLIGKKILPVVDQHGTLSFFYISSTKKSYEYFTINDSVEESRKIDILPNIHNLPQNFPNYPIEKNVINVNIQTNIANILTSQTVIVDSPGLFQDDKIDEEIKKQSVDTDIFILVFDIKSPVTLKHNDFLNQIRINSRNPFYLFIYNKCDEIAPNINPIEFKNELIKIFDERFVSSSYIDEVPLYFICTKNIFNGYFTFSFEYKRFEKILLEKRNQKLMSLNNVYVQTSKKISTFQYYIVDLMRNEKNKKSKMKKNILVYESEIAKLDNFSNNLKNNLATVNRESVQNLNAKKFIQKIILNINEYDQSCTVSNANLFTCIMADSIDQIILQQLQDYLERTWYIPLKYQIENEIMENRLNLSCFQLNGYPHFLITEIAYNFTWSFGRDKTKKVKEDYIKLVKNREEDIITSVNKYYESQISSFLKIIERNVNDIKKMKSMEKEIMVEKYMKTDNLILALEKYNDKCLASLRNYESSLDF